MIAETNEEVPMINRRRRYVMRAVRAAAVTLAVVVLAYGVWYAWAVARLSRAKARARAEGLCLSLDELRLPPLPDDENMAVDLWKLAEDTPEHEAYDQLVASLGDYHEMWDLDDPRRKAEHLLTAQQAVSKLKELEKPPMSIVYSVIDQMTAKSGYSPRIDWSKGYDTKLPHLAPLRGASRLLCFRAWLKLSANDSTGASRDYLAALRLSTYPKDERVLISQLVRIAMDMSTVQAIQSAYRDFGDQAFTQEQLSALVDAIETHRHPGSSPAMAVAMEGEAALVANGFGAFVNGTDTMGPYFSELPWWQRHLLFVAVRPHLEGEFAFTLDQLVKLRRQADMPATMANRVPFLREEIPDRYLLAVRVLPTWRKQHYKFSDHESRLAVAKAGLVVIGYKLEHGEYPTENAARSQWILPTDPFTGSPVHYQLTADGFKVWSIGRDYTDDGGQRYDVDPPFGDVVWQIGDAAE